MDHELREELEQWETQFHEHTENLEMDLKEIEDFADQDILDSLTDSQKQLLKKNLVHFIKQVA
ncbi:hypothetical protein [Enterococcus wangshanyuanii]|uniref:Uncharacterized protein n=1 Tax=Enterococcus wangshanyuanii TaxID=2005703 RepID=A0ABQ1PV48_9ENTE|nr:hypothetical protein [Enterococcus wangshanyuanii]GGD04368.1 hypothetical protein GCM10011573_37380 [Enterococcus wangshanyuanii]